jgi:hypothetical protein
VIFNAIFLSLGAVILYAGVYVGQHAADSGSSGAKSMGTGLIFIGSISLVVGLMGG